MEWWGQEGKGQEVIENSRHRERGGGCKEEKTVVASCQGLVGHGNTGGFCNQTLLNLGRKGSDEE